MNTKFTTTRTVSTLTFVLLCAFTGSAFSQSAEYRRGYDQGYRDGAEAQSDQSKPGRISIEEAFYGSRGASCDVKDGIQRAAGWRRQVSIRVNNDLCGDPAPNRNKRLNVSYRCGDSAPQRASAAEGGTLTISCR